MLKESLRTRIKVFFLVVGFLPLLLFSFLFPFITKIALKRATYNNLQTYVENATRDITQLMSRGYLGIKILSNHLLIASPRASRSEKVAEMRRVQEFYTLYERISLVDLEGRIIASTKLNLSENWADQPWFRKVKEGKTLIADLYLSGSSRKTLVFAAPVLDSKNKPLYVIGGEVNLDLLGEITNKFKIGGSGYITLINETGKVLAHPQKDMILQPLNSSELLEDVLRNNQSQTRQVERASYNFRHGRNKEIKVLAVSSPLFRETNYIFPAWYAIAIEPESEIFVLMGTIQKWAWMLAGIGLLFILPVSLGLTQSVMKPIQALVLEVQRISKGNLKSRLRISSSDELGELNRSINEIVEALEKHTRNLQLIQEKPLELEITAESRSRKLAIINNISQLVSSAVNAEEALLTVVAIAGRVLEANKCSLMLIEGNSKYILSKYEYQRGRPQAEIINFSISLERYPELQKAIETQKSIVISDVQRDPLMREVRSLLTRLEVRSILVLPVMAEGKILGLLVLRWYEKTDVLKWEEIRLGETIASQISTALKNVQFLARERRSEQMKTEFTRILAEDLKNPLAAITSFSKALMRTIVEEGRLQEERYIRNIFYYANLLSDTIQDILDIYKMEEGNLELQEETVPLIQLIETAVEQFEVQAKQKGVDLIVEVPEMLPWVRVDSQLFIRILENILHNRIKYTHQGGKVIFGVVKRERGELWVKIRDTRARIPAAHIYKIFDKFFQVEGQEAEGEISISFKLYFCKLAIEAHGGQIWAESQDGEGSTFYLEIPSHRVIQ